MLEHAPPYRVDTPIFEGPLDLLLQLIEKAELDITRLALARVTDQFLEYLSHLEQRSAEEVSAFLVIASKLLQIKSEALLPRPTHREEGEEHQGRVREVPGLRNQQAEDDPRITEYDLAVPPVEE